MADFVRQDPVEEIFLLPEGDDFFVAVWGPVALNRTLRPGRLAGFLREGWAIGINGDRDAFVPCPKFRIARVADHLGNRVVIFLGAPEHGARFVVGQRPGVMDDKMIAL